MLRKVVPQKAPAFEPAQRNSTKKTNVPEGVINLKYTAYPVKSGPLKRADLNSLKQLLVTIIILLLFTFTLTVLDKFDITAAI